MPLGQIQTPSTEYSWRPYHSPPVLSYSHCLRMKSLIQVELNYPTTLNRNLSLPKRRPSAIAFPLLLGVLRILTVIGIVVCIAKEVIHTEDEPTFIFLYILFVVFCTYEVLFLNLYYDLGTFEDKGQFLEFSRNLHICRVIKWIFAVGRFLGFLPLNIFSCYLLIALLVHFFVEQKMFEQYSNHYERQFEALEDGLIDDIKELFGNDHKLGQRLYGELCELSSDIEETFWEGVAVESRNQSIVPKALYSKQNEDGVTEYFVDWTSYADITEVIGTDFVRMCIMARRCDELRRDLTTQNGLIKQCREKLCGSKSDSTDIEEAPAKTPIPPFWIQEKAACIFTYSKGCTNIYVKMIDYREMAQHVFLISGSVPMLENEKKLLKKDLQKGKEINNELMRKVLRLELTKQG